MPRSPILSRRTLLGALAASGAAPLLPVPAATAQVVPDHPADPVDRRGAARGRAR